MYICILISEYSYQYSERNVQLILSGKIFKSKFFILILQIRWLQNVIKKLLVFYVIGNSITARS